MAEIFGIDMGSGSILIYSSTRGVVLKEPFVLALSRKDEKILAMGLDAIGLEKKSGLYRIINPLKDGRFISELIEHFMEKAIYGRDVFRPRVVFTIHEKMTKKTIDEFTKGLKKAEAREIYMYPRIVADAVGSGIDIYKEEATTLIRIGKTTISFSVISSGEIKNAAFLDVGSIDIDREILRVLKGSYNLIISLKEAEKIKMNLPSIMEKQVMEKILVSGRDKFLGVLTEREVSVMEMKKAVIRVLMPCVEKFISFIESVNEPERSDIKDRGLLLTGGGSMQRGLNEFIEKETSIEVVKAPLNIEKCAVGAIEMLKVKKEG